MQLGVGSRWKNISLICKIEWVGTTMNQHYIPPLMDHDSLFLDNKKAASETFSASNEHSFQSKASSTREEKIAWFLGKHTFFQENRHFKRKLSFFLEKRKVFYSKQLQSNSRKTFVFTKIVFFLKKSYFFNRMFSLSCGQGLPYSYFVEAYYHKYIMYWGFLVGSPDSSLLVSKYNIL